MEMQPNLYKEKSNLHEIDFKGLFHQPPPSGRESVIKVVGLIILKMNRLSILQMNL